MLTNLKTNKIFDVDDDDDDNNDSDYLIALQIQYDLDDEYTNSKKNDETSMKHAIELSKPLKNEKNNFIVSPEWELIDPNPDIRALFQEYDKKYFYSRLGSCIVEWSKRMTICAGIFYLREGGIIRLSEPLLKYRPRIDMVQTLLHEMIHAYLYLTRNFKDRGEHGDEFKSHMNRINKEAGTNITVYHSFHDEVNHCRQHVWRCTGVCRQWKPFYGYVKRSMNRAPGPNDIWWADHSRKCTGKFEKISEPESYTKSKAKSIKRKSDENDDDSSFNQTKTTIGNKSIVANKKKPALNDSSLVKLDKFFKINNSQPSSSSSSSFVISSQQETTSYYSTSNQIESKTKDNLFVKNYQKSEIDHTQSRKCDYDDNEEDILILNEIKSTRKNQEIFVLDDVATNSTLIECPICFIQLNDKQIDGHVNSHFD